jgi:hypothetical protein
MRFARAVEPAPTGLTEDESNAEMGELKLIGGDLHVESTQFPDVLYTWHGALHKPKSSDRMARCGYK